jgi:hypothetical protein
MQEFIPLALGVPLALAVAAIHNTRTRWTATLAGAVVLGILTSATVGELEESWAFALVDIAQVLFAAVAVMLLRERFARAGAAEKG